MQAASAPSTRRAVLAGAIAMSGAAASAAAASPGVSVEAAIQASATRIGALATRLDIAAKEHSRLEGLVIRRAGSPPEPPVGAASYDAWCSARDAYKARRKAAEDHFGFGLFNAAFDKLLERQVDACLALAAMPATTLPGLVAKAQIAQRLHNETLAESIIADLIALGAQA